MTDMYKKEKRSIKERQAKGGNLIASLFRASISTTVIDPQQENVIGGQCGLTESEVYGNLFVFNFAGHDTTAHTLLLSLLHCLRSTRKFKTGFRKRCATYLSTKHRQFDHSTRLS